MICKLSHEKSTLSYLGIWVVLDFHHRPWQIPARSWMPGINNENTSTVKATWYQTQQHMGILLASAWSIMPNLWLPQPTQKAISILCRMNVFKPAWLSEFTMVLAMQEKQACVIGTFISSKNLNKAFIILGAFNSVPTNLLIGDSHVLFFNGPLVVESSINGYLSGCCNVWSFIINKCKWARSTKWCKLRQRDMIIYGLNTFGNVFRWHIICVLWCVKEVLFNFFSLTSSNKLNYWFKIVSEPSFSLSTTI